MRTLLRATAFLFFLFALFLGPNRAQAAGPALAIVQWGDTLYSIAARYSTSVEALVRANGLPSANFIYAGQRLVIPAGNPAPVPSGSGVYVVRAGDTLFSIARRFGTTVQALLRANGLASPNFIYTGQRLNVGSTVPVKDPPAPGGNPRGVPNPPNAGKWIAVNLSTQTATAYEDSRVVRSVLVSTGVTKTPTPVGRYRIYVKYKAQTMTGGNKASGDYYYLPNVPNVMYFYRDYALHGTYWHRNFGRPMSRGCVNLSLADAEWFFNWAQVGTTVITY